MKMLTLKDHGCGELYTLAEWINTVNAGYINDEDGSAYYAKGHLYSHEHYAFDNPAPEWADGVVYFSK